MDDPIKVIISDGSKPSKKLPRCPCGEDHTSRFDKQTRRFIRRTIKRNGRVQPLTVTGVGTWLVPRIYVAAHGLKAEELPALAAQYGWEEVGPHASST